MEYKWKMPGLYPIKAQVAGEELERIYSKNGSMNPSIIVDESRPEDAALHPCFEWNDPIAAEKWREQQARGIVNCIVVKAETQRKEPIEVRAFVHVQESYHPVNVVLESKDMTAEMIADALSDMKNFTKKYNSLSALAEVIAAIEKTINEIEKEKNEND